MNNKTSAGVRTNTVDVGASIIQAPPLKQILGPQSRKPVQHFAAFPKREGSYFLAWPGGQLHSWVSVHFYY